MLSKRRMISKLTAMVVSGCVLFWVSIVMLGCAFATLQPLEFGIEYNKNTRKLLENKVFQGGRHFVGIGHTFVKLPAHRMILAFTTWPQLGRGLAECTDDDSEEEEVENLCLEGVMADQEEIRNSYTQVYGPVSCRTNDGLKITVETAITFSLGIGRDDPEKDKEDDLYFPPPTTERLRKSLVWIYHVGGEEGWKQLVHQASKAVLRDEVSRHNASAFYQDRKRMGNLVTSRMMEHFETHLKMTVHALDMTSVLFPAEFEAAIQRTEIAKQRKFQATYEQETRIIESETLKAQSETRAGTLNETAARFAEAELLAKTITADIIQYKIGMQGEAFRSVKEIMGMEENQDLLNFMWLMSVGDHEGSQLTFDQTVPTSLLHSE